MKIYHFLSYDGSIAEKEVIEVKNGRFYYMVGRKKTWSPMQSTPNPYFLTREEAVNYGISQLTKRIDNAKSTIKICEKQLEGLKK